MTKQLLVHIKKWINTKGAEKYSCRIIDSDYKCIHAMSCLSPKGGDMEAILHVARSFNPSLKDKVDVEDLATLLKRDSFIVITQASTRDELERWGMKPHD